MKRAAGPSLVFAVSATAAWFYIGQRTPDFSVIHAAARGWPGPIYDQAYLASLQGGRNYPFAYPPTVLMFALPLGQLSLQAAYAVWVGLSSAALVAAARLLAGSWAYCLPLTPLVFLAEVNGQTTILIAALATAGLAQTGRPAWAGALLGLSACIKPHLLILAPLGLLVGGRWRDAAYMALTGIIACGLSIAILGVHAWREWIAALPAFMRLNDVLGLPGIAPKEVWLRAALASLALCFVWWAFRGRDRSAQIAAALGGPLLFGPHVMAYDLVLLAPAILAFFARPWLAAPIGAIILLGLFRSWIAVLVMLAAIAVQSSIIRNKDERPSA